MTQYSDKVEEVRLKQAAQNWGKQVKHLHFNNGIEEIKFQNGDVHFHDTNTGKKWRVYNVEPQNLVEMYQRWRATYRGK